MFKKILFTLTIILLFAAAACTPVEPAAGQEPTEPPVIVTDPPAPTDTPAPTETPDEPDVIGPPASDEDFLVAALAESLDADPDELTVVIEQLTETHARGGVDNGYFLAAKVDGEWVIVADGQGAIPCDVVAQYVFPVDMVPECAEVLSSYDPSLAAALAAHLGTSVEDLTIVVDQNTGTHARGGVDNGYFLAAKVDGEWVIVADGQGAIPCEAIAQYAFPADMVPECEAAGGAANVDPALAAALAAHLGTSVEDLTIVVEENTGTHARGGVDNGYFLAAKVDGEWVIVADGQGVIPCESIADYAFPLDMVPECSDALLELEAITAALAEHLDMDADDLSVTVEQNTGLHARGLAENGYFLAKKIDGEWVILADGQGAIDCDLVSEYDFPAAMVPECGG